MDNLTPIYEAVAEAQGYRPGEAELLTHEQYVARQDRRRRIARKVAAANGKRPATKKAPVKKSAAKKSAAKRPARKPAKKSAAKS